MKHTYRFTGTQPEELVSLSGELVAGYPLDGGDVIPEDDRRGSALVEEGDEITLSVPVVHPFLEPADDDTRAATDREEAIQSASRAELVELVRAAPADLVDGHPVLAEIARELADEDTPAEAPVRPSPESVPTGSSEGDDAPEGAKEPAEAKPPRRGSSTKTTDEAGSTPEED